MLDTILEVLRIRSTLGVVGILIVWIGVGIVLCKWLCKQERDNKRAFFWGVFVPLLLIFLIFLYMIVGAIAEAL